MRSLALFLFNLRATGMRHALVPLIIAGIPIALMAYARPAGTVFLREPILLAMLGIMAAMTPAAAVGFSPLEDLVVRGRALRKSLPLSSWDFAMACAAALLAPALLTVLFGLAGIWILFGADLGAEGLLFAALFSLRMVAVGCLVILLGFWARIVWGERAWLRSGGALLPFLIFGGIVLSKSGWGAALLLRCFLSLARPYLGWSDVLIILLAGTSLVGTAFVEDGGR